MSRNRIAWVDVLKFFGIFAIYLGHFGASAGLGYSFVFKYHVPLFFFVAGYTEALSIETKIFPYIKKKTKTLLIPWLVFALLSIVLMVLITNSSISVAVDSLGLVLKGTIRNTFFASSLWFLTCLYIISILFVFIKKLKYKSLYLIVSLLLFIISEKILPYRPVQQPSQILNVDSALYYMIFFVIGYISFGTINKLIEFKSLRSKIIFCISGGISLAYSSLLFFQKDMLSFMNAIPYIDMLKPVFTALIVIWFFICLSYICKNIKLFNDIGKNTLYLCGSEYIVKNLVFYLVSIFALNITLKSPLTVYIYSFLLLYIANKFLVPIERRLINKITTPKSLL